MPRKKLLPDECRVNHHGDSNSERANEVLHPHKERVEGIIVDFVSSRGNYGATAEEISLGTGIKFNTVTGRNTVLWNYGQGPLCRPRRRASIKNPRITSWVHVALEHMADWEVDLCLLEWYKRQGKAE